jgi:preprotein translocase subunit SecA
MFGQMMHGIAQDFVRYIMHVQVMQQPAETVPSVQNVQMHSGEDAPTGAQAMEAAAAGVAMEEGGPTQMVAPEPAVMQPIVKDEWSKTGRNQPCPCGSGKKYKMCHGK